VPGILLIAIAPALAASDLTDSSHWPSLWHTTASPYCYHLVRLSLGSRVFLTLALAAAFTPAALIAPKSPRLDDQPGHPRHHFPRSRRAGSNVLRLPYLTSWVSPLDSYRLSGAIKLKLVILIALGLLHALSIPRSDIRGLRRRYAAHGY
jgi:hypothetical protein